MRSSHSPELIFYKYKIVNPISFLEFRSVYRRDVDELLCIFNEILWDNLSLKLVLNSKRLTFFENEHECRPPMWWAKPVLDIDTFLYMVPAN